MGKLGRGDHFSMNILGITSYHESASAAIVCDGQLVAACEEERFNRIKYWGGFPTLAVRYCLKEAGLKASDIDHIAIPRNPYARLGRKLLFALSMPSFAWKRTKDNARFSEIPTTLEEALECDPAALKAKVHRMEHHRAHMASAFFVSPFEDAAVFSIDSLGDFASCMWGSGQGSRMDIDGAVAFPHSLGMYYSAISQYLGFPKFGDEYKVMGLAAYGDPDYLDAFRKIVRYDEKNDRLDFRLDLKYFIHHTKNLPVVYPANGKTAGRRRFYSDELVRKFGPARSPEEPLEKHHRDLAASLQARLEEVYLGMLRKLAKNTGQRKVCLAGGVAFNCVANGKSLESTPFEKVFVHPAAGDAGLAVGAAFYVWNQVLGNPRNFVMNHAYWGPAFDRAEIQSALESRGVASNGHELTELAEPELVERAAEIIEDGKILGWFQGRSEWGPRALGNRSIVADPRRADMKGTLNRRIKHREIFRPFAPSVLAEATGEWFERSHPSPFMSLAYSVRREKRELIPAPTHVDGTARLQTVEREANPRYWALIKAFEKRTGVPMVVNTSFNDNEPVVNRPEEALDCFLRTEMDAVILGNFLVKKSAQARQRTLEGDADTREQAVASAERNS
jgi:carbamoyltransferase